MWSQIVFVGFPKQIAHRAPNVDRFARDVFRTVYAVTAHGAVHHVAGHPVISSSLACWFKIGRTFGVYRTEVGFWIRHILVPRSRLVGVDLIGFVTAAR